MGFSGIRVSGLSRAYEDEYALVGLDADFPAGTVTAVLGPNGAGKSTLLHLLSLLSRPTEGRVIFDGREANTLLARDRARVGYVGHQTMLYSALSGEENLAFFGRIYGVPELKERVSEQLRAVGLADEGSRPVREYSRGMKQRLTIARALLPRPDVLLLDEPFTGLDQGALREMVRLFSAARERGAAIILVSHDLSTSSTLADRALVLRAGRKMLETDVHGDLGAVYQNALASKGAA